MCPMDPDVRAHKTGVCRRCGMALTAEIPSPVEYHLDVSVSEDLEFFEHAHPAVVGEGMFQHPVRLPEPGMYRVLSDFYPSGGTPQLGLGTVFIPGSARRAQSRIVRDYSPKTGQNMRIALETFPDQPAAGTRTQLRFTIDEAGGLQLYLGAWGHLLTASDDLIDMMHEHPLRTDGGLQIDFEVVFPRPRTYRVWTQFQRNGTVNTVHFDVPVRRLD